MHKSALSQVQHAMDATARFLHFDKGKRISNKREPQEGRLYPLFSHGHYPSSHVLPWEQPNWTLSTEQIDKHCGVNGHRFPGWVMAGEDVRICYRMKPIDLIFDAGFCFYFGKHASLFQSLFCMALFKQMTPADAEDLCAIVSHLSLSLSTFLLCFWPLSLNLNFADQAKEASLES